VAPVLIALLGVLGTLGGVVLGARQEQRRWLRDKRLEAYVDLNTAVHEFDVAWSRQVESRDAHGLMAAFAALNEHRDRVLLVAPPEVREAALAVVAAATHSVAGFGKRARIADGEEPMLRFMDCVKDLHHAQRVNVQGRRRSRQEAGSSRSSRSQLEQRRTGEAASAG
jgi:hypothetical protein